MSERDIRTKLIRAGRERKELRNRQARLKSRIEVLVAVAIHQHGMTKVEIAKLLDTERTNLHVTYMRVAKELDSPDHA